MSKVIDISAKLRNEPKFLMVSENKTYKVDDRKNTVLEINELLGESGGTAEVMDKVIRKTLGDEAFREIEEMELSFDAYQSLFIGIMAAVQNKTYEETEEAFRKAV